MQHIHDGKANLLLTQTDAIHITARRDIYRYCETCIIIAFARVTHNSWMQKHRVTR